jgi:WD repeat-containing protein 35
MRWSNDGTTICIIYEDGTVISGTVEGNRNWGIQVNNQQDESQETIKLELVEWTPDDKYILLMTRNNEFRLYEKNGTFVKLININERCIMG